MNHKRTCHLYRKDCCNPLGTLINVEDQNPILVETSITWAGPTLQPLMGSFDIEGCSGIHPPEGSRQIFACD